VDNLLNATVQAEVAFGVAKGHRHVFLVRTSLATGVSVVAEGQLVRAANLSAGQIGHIKVAGSRAACTCGRVGCLDAVASGRAILQAAGLSAPGLGMEEEAARLGRFLEETERGDQRGAKILVRAGRALGNVLATLISGLQPQQVIFTGPVGRSAIYRRGVMAGLDEFGGLHAHVPEHHVSTLSTREAAVRLALKELMSPSSEAVDRLVELAASRAARGAADNDVVALGVGAPVARARG
jgi:predicted NBD/HSP70 family sugar kinase